MCVYDDSTECHWLYESLINLNTFKNIKKRSRVADSESSKYWQLVEKADIGQKNTLTSFVSGLLVQDLLYFCVC